MDLSFNNNYDNWDSIQETNWPSSFSNTFYIQGNNFNFNNDQENENNYDNHFDGPILESNEIIIPDTSQNYLDSNNDLENQPNNQLNNNITYSLLNRPSRNSNRQNLSFIFQRRTRRRRINPLEDIILNPLNSTLVNYSNDEDQDYNDEYYSQNNANPNNNDNIILNNNLSPFNIINSDTQFISNFDSDNSIIRSILENSFTTDKNKYKNVLHDPSGHVIKIVKFNSQTNINSSCPIFQLDFEENEEVAILPCKHCFTIEAITKWLNEQKAECPVCREQFSSKEISEENTNSLEESEQTPLLPETYFRNTDLTDTIRSMLDIIYERNEERQLQQVLLESTYSDS